MKGNGGRFGPGLQGRDRALALVAIAKVCAHT